MYFSILAKSFEINVRTIFKVQNYLKLKKYRKKTITCGINTNNDTNCMVLNYKYVLCLIKE